MKKAILNIAKEVSKTLPPINKLYKHKKFLEEKVNTLNERTKVLTAESREVAQEILAKKNYELVFQFHENSNKCFFKKILTMSCSSRCAIRPPNY